MGVMSRCSWGLLLFFLDCGSADPQCIPRTLDFVILEGDAMNAAVEDDIRRELLDIGITVNARFLNRTLFNAAMTSGDFHMCFSETWGAPYDPVSYMTGWLSNNEAHYSAMSGVTGPNSRQNIFNALNAVLTEQVSSQRETEWAAIHQMVHQSAVNLPLWGKRIPAVLNQRLSNYVAGQQQFDYPVHQVVVQSGSTTVTIAPGAQTGLFQSVGRLDPHSYRPNEFFANNWVYEGLVSYGQDGAILPALATSWTETANGVTFTLRQGVTFTDGAAWNCAVAKLNFEHVFASPMRTADWHGWYHLPSVIDTYTCDSNDNFVITTSSPSSVLLQELSFIRPHRMLSPNSFGSQAADSWQTHNTCPTGWGPTISHNGVTITCVGINGITNAVGTGPFKFVSRTQAQSGGSTVDTEVVFDRNTQWWGGTPSIHRLVVKRYETAAAVAAALLDGSLDMVAGDGVLTPASINSFMANSNFRVIMTPVIMHSIIIINSGREPTNNIRLRKAIIHGVDKAPIIQSELGGLAEAVDRIFPRSAPLSSVELTPRWDYDLEKATMLNCPEPLPTLPPTTTTLMLAASSDDDDDETEALAIGLGLGFGIPLVITIGVAIALGIRSRKAETELQKLLTNVSPTPCSADSDPAPATVTIGARN